MSQLVPRNPGLRKSLRLRLTLASVLAVVSVSAVGTYFDYRREREELEQAIVTSLKDQAQTLNLGRQNRSPDELAAFVESFCEVLNAHVSPGHVILLFGPDGETLAQSYSSHDKAVVEALRPRDSVNTFPVIGGRRYAKVRLEAEDGVEIVMAQDMIAVQGRLRDILRSHIISTTVSALAIIGLTLIAFQLWAVRPIRQLAVAAKAWASMRFEERAALPGPSELRFLTEELHDMAEELHRHERERLANMERARKIQHNLLPRLAPAEHGVKLAGQYWPLEHVAGDLYDVFELPDGRMVAAVIDIAGHGVGAALLTGVVKMSLRYRLVQTLCLDQALVLVNQDLLACTLGQKFAVLSVGVWNRQTRTWTYAAAGHEGCTIFSNGSANHLTSTGPMLGLLPDARWSTCEMLLRDGDRVFLYTDGVTEAGVLGEELLGTEGVEAVLQMTAERDLDGQVAGVMEEASRRGRGEATDDITLLAFQICPVNVADHQQVEMHDAAKG